MISSSSLASFEQLIIREKEAMRSCSYPDRSFSIPSVKMNVSWSTLGLYSVRACPNRQRKKNIWPRFGFLSVQEKIHLLNPFRTEFIFHWKLFLFIRLLNLTQNLLMKYLYYPIKQVFFIYLDEFTIYHRYNSWSVSDLPETARFSGAHWTDNYQCESVFTLRCL